VRNLITILVGLTLHVGWAQGPAPAWTASLAQIRATAAAPAPAAGSRPLRINVVKFAESRRTKNFSVQGAPVEPSIQARTAFQVVYAGRTVMIDAGMDEQVHRFFGRGVEEPYDAAAARTVEDALGRASAILFTHEHGDHVAGVLRGPRAAELAPKVMLTREQASVLMTAPQMPEIALTPELMDRLRIGVARPLTATSPRIVVTSYDTYLPGPAGIVLIKAAGHTPGSQMIYVALESGREYLLIGDVTWHMDGVREAKGKDAPWVTEDRAAVLAQLAWLNGLSRTDPQLLIVASHDEEQRLDLIRRGVLGGTFE
jgi:glyoxylase-like metal-dependent hydrolase (beta-lactamase superfamily II)